MKNGTNLKSFKDLIVWQKAVDLGTIIFKKPLNFKSYILNPHLNLGFTLIEVVLALGILAAISAVAGVNIYNYRLRRGLDFDAQKITVALREARNRSVSQLDGNQWGLHFENPAGAPDFYQVFSSSTYASGTPVGNRINLNTGVIFLDPAAGAFKDVVFSKASGLPANATSVAIGLNSGAASTTVSIDVQGKVSF